MNNNLMAVALFGAGTILLYGAIRDKMPKEVVSMALAGSQADTQPAPPAAPPAGDPAKREYAQAEVSLPIYSPDTVGGPTR